MHQLKHIAIVLLTSLAGGCVFAVNTGRPLPAPPVPPVWQSGGVAIPSNATLVIYGRGDEIATMPKPVLAPGVLYLYDEELQSVTLVVPHAKAGEVDIVPQIKTLPHHYRVYYVPDGSFAPTPAAPAASTPVRLT